MNSRIQLAGLMTVAAVAVTGCSQPVVLIGSGNLMEMQPAVQPFKYIDVSGEFNVRILEGTSCKAIVRAEH